MGQTLMLIGAILAALFFILGLLQEESSEKTTLLIVATLMFGMFISGLRGDTVSASVCGGACSIIFYLKECHKK